MDDKLKPKVVNIVVLTVSDTRTEADDKSGQTLVDRIKKAGHHLVEKRIVKDEVPLLQAALKEWIAREDVDVVIATGGTGVTGRDVTPEAFEALYDKPIPGFGELFRMLSHREIGAAAMLSRAVAGVRGRRVLFSLPGSPAAVRLALEELILPELGHLVGQLDA